MLDPLSPSLHFRGDIHLPPFSPSQARGDSILRSKDAVRPSTLALWLLCHLLNTPATIRAVTSEGRLHCAARRSCASCDAESRAVMVSTLPFKAVSLG
jgi:hypothetical protein